MTVDITSTAPRHQIVGVGRMERSVREIMRPGVVTVVEGTSLGQAMRAMVDHSVHAILVVGQLTGTPLGWITSRGLIGLLEADPFRPCSQAITETPTYVGPNSSAAEAASALSEPGVTHLLVAHMPGHPPEGVVSDLDLIRLVAS
jgi:CBS domain-containing protein